MCTSPVDPEARTAKGSQGLDAMLCYAAMRHMGEIDEGGRTSDARPRGIGIANDPTRPRTHSV